MTPVRVEWRKWPATPYRHTPMTRLGTDHEGTWLFAPRGAEGTYANVGAVPLQANFLTLLPWPEKWWMCTWMWGNPEIEIEIYVDIVFPPSWRSISTLEVVDLDLDVIRHRDGSVRLDDEDEFERNSVSFQYPDAVISAVRSTSTDVLRAVAESEPPFVSAPARWRNAAAERDPG